MRGRPLSMSAASASAVALPVAAANPGPGRRAVVPGSKRERQRAIRDLVTSESIASQQHLADRLEALGFAVTQATVSRDIAELGLVKAPRRGSHVYVVPEALVARGDAGRAAASHSDERLRRILADIPVTIGRSGLILLVTGSPGTASVIAQAIDESSLTEQEGTLAGDNTLLVLFADEDRLARWRTRFDEILATTLGGS